MDKDHVSAFASGEPNTAYPQYFTGQSYLKMLTKGKIPVANVTFEPGCRNHRIRNSVRAPTKNRSGRPRPAVRCLIMRWEFSQL